MANTTPIVQSPKAQARISPITDPSDLPRFFDITASAFGSQTKDGLWIANNPSWDTVKGRESAIARLTERWKSTTINRNGGPNTVFLQATVTDEDTGTETVAGVAIWVQLSMLEGYGDKPVADLSKAIDLDALYPGDEGEQDYLCQIDYSLHRRRIQVIQEIASSSSPAVFALDLCAVDPAFQRRGVANALVQWGLDEARRRGGLEAVTEASSMGRRVYMKMGFQQEGGEIVYNVDRRFTDRDRPSNVFLRTGRPA
ncbi:GNAT family N-acetyltransferase [Aspergillus undulatus]|uniref:GNAT family N-acetyltransferase n=1 Tax=Aspergillus undulatus TaxID=1810928 RepID=UPI003CCCD9DE